MPYASNGKNLMLNALKGTNPTTPITHSSLHSSIPDDTGSNEISGGSPAYARKAISFAAASGGSIAASSSPVFDVPPATTVSFVGFWSASTSGTFLGFAPVNGGSVKGDGTAIASTDKITSPGHGLANTNRVFLLGVAGASVPTGLSATTLYFVVGVSGNDFQVSLTSGGSAVDITADGEVFFQQVVSDTFGAQGTLTVNTATLDLNG